MSGLSPAVAEHHRVAGTRTSLGFEANVLSNGRATRGGGRGTRQERLLRDFRRLTPKVRAEVARLVRAIAGA